MAVKGHLYLQGISAHIILTTVLAQIGLKSLRIQITNPSKKFGFVMLPTILLECKITFLMSWKLMSLKGKWQFYSDSYTRQKGKQSNVQGVPRKISHFHSK